MSNMCCQTTVVVVGKSTCTMKAVPVGGLLSATPQVHPCNAFLQELLPATVNQIPTSEHVEVFDDHAGGRAQLSGAPA